MADTLIVADMKKLIAETFGDAITSLDLKLPRMEQSAESYEEQKRTFKSLFTKLRGGLDALGKAKDDEQRAKVQSKLITFAEQEIGPAFGVVLGSFCDMVRNHIE